jgi:hypothetical protein
MKVLEAGRPQRGWSIEARCTGAGNGNGGCGALLLVEQADLFKTFSHCRDETDTFVTFKCTCGVLTDLQNKHWPPHDIVGALPDRRKWEATQPSGGDTGEKR